MPPSGADQAYGLLALIERRHAQAAAILRDTEARTGGALEGVRKLAAQAGEWASQAHTAIAHLQSALEQSIADAAVASRHHTDQVRDAAIQQAEARHAEVCAALASADECLRQWVTRAQQEVDGRLVSLDEQLREQARLNVETAQCWSDALASVRAEVAAIRAHPAPLPIRFRWQGTALEILRGPHSVGPAIDLRGSDGKDGDDGQEGAIGPMPRHEWNRTGTRVRFEQSPKVWGDWSADLTGPVGASVGGGTRRGGTRPRYTRPLFGFAVVIPAAEHGIASPITALIRDAAGLIAQACVVIGADQSVSVTAVRSMDGLTLTLE